MYTTWVANIMTDNCHNLGTVNKPEEEVITVDTMRKTLKDTKQRWWVVSDSNARPTD